MKQHKAFVMMPSGNHDEYQGGAEESDFIYQGIIVPAIRDVLGNDVIIEREVDNRKPGAITREIIRKLAESDLAIVDITGQNPNVFLELGVRYALRRAITILLRQKGTPIPFDITNFRSIEYKPHFNGPEIARRDIATALKQAISKGGTSDSLVFEVLPNLEVTLPSIETSTLDSDRIMPWGYFMKRLDLIVSRASDLVRDGRYVPVAVVGITNGGAMFADLLVRKLFDTSTPTLSLWANRSNHHGFFDNEINIAIAAGLAAISAAKNNANILLVDDIVASGTTIHQAIEFIKKSLPTRTEIRFLPLFSRNEKYFDVVKDHILWKHRVFHVTDEEILELHRTEWPRLPYAKDIRSS